MLLVGRYVKFYCQAQSGSKRLSLQHCLAMFILVPKKAFLYESPGQRSGSNFVESAGGVNSQEEILQTSYWQFNSLFEETIAKRHIATSASN